VVIPAFNEEAGIADVLTSLGRVLSSAGWQYELIVIDDGCTDATAEVALANKAVVVTHPQNLGYGRSLKTGIQNAKHDTIVITDADGTYPVEPVPHLLDLLDRYHMVVAQRTGATYHGSLLKRLGRHLFRWLSEYATGHSIPDINSGLRVFRRSEIMPFFPSISTGFSFTTTTTLVYLLNEMFVLHVPIGYRERVGSSKVRYVSDTLRALQIVLEAILRYNPIKVFLLVSIPMAVLGTFLLVVALAVQSPLAALMGMLCIVSSLIVLSHGFLSVSLVSSRRSAVRRSLEHVRGGCAGDAERPSMDLWQQ
jgi:polyisoprenyl-phosphate glycosyltransferase